MVCSLFCDIGRKCLVIVPSRFSCWICGIRCVLFWWLSASLNFDRPELVGLEVSSREDRRSPERGCHQLQVSSLPERFWPRIRQPTGMGISTHSARCRVIQRCGVRIKRRVQPNWWSTVHLKAAALFGSYAEGPQKTVRLVLSGCCQYSKSISEGRIHRKTGETVEKNILPLLQFETNSHVQKQKPEIIFHCTPKGHCMFSPLTHPVRRCHVSPCWLIQLSTIITIQTYGKQWERFEDEKVSRALNTKNLWQGYLKMLHYPSDTGPFYTSIKFCIKQRLANHWLRPPKSMFSPWVISSNIALW